jgi:WASH complex subunit 7, C-terminal
MALPALVAAAVEAGLVAKEALLRRRRGGTPAGFTDDGFPLGVAFLLKVGNTNICSNSRMLPHVNTIIQLICNSCQFCHNLLGTL